MEKNIVRKRLVFEDPELTEEEKRVIEERFFYYLVHKDELPNSSRLKELLREKLRDKIFP
jgi:hypothetical protein